MIKYWYDDCLVLAAAFSRFIESMINELKRSGIQGIVDHDFTIIADFMALPQLLIHWFVCCMMLDRTIAVVPNGGYDSRKGGLLKERVWLTYVDREHEHVEGNEFVPIISRYCFGRGQQRVGAYYLDGYRELNDGRSECYEFHGCYFHGCPICFPDRSKVVRCKHREDSYVTIGKVYIDTMDRERLIKCMMNFNKSVDKWIVMWEHDYNENESSIKAKLDKQSTYDLVGKLNPNIGRSIYSIG